VETLKYILVCLAAVAASVGAPHIQRRLGWMRPNHAGRIIPSEEGIGILFVALTGFLLQGEFAGAVLLMAYGSAGLFDDLVGDRSRGGIGGHLAALREGIVTTGLVKLILLPLVAISWAFVAVSAGWTTRLVDSVLVAGLANIVNLLDTRAGRARAGTMLLFVPAALCAKWWGALGSAWFPVAISCFPGAARDRRGEGMLGDIGSNVLGGMVAWFIVKACPTWFEWIAAIIVVGLHVISEKISFHVWLTSTPVVRRLDAWTGVR